MNYEPKQVAVVTDNHLRRGTLYPWVQNKKGWCWVEWELLYPGSGLRSGAFVEVAA